MYNKIQSWKFKKKTKSLQQSLLTYVFILYLLYCTVYIHLLTKLSCILASIKLNFHLHVRSILNFRAPVLSMLRHYYYPEYWYFRFHPYKLPVWWCRTVWLGPEVWWSCALPPLSCQVNNPSYFLSAADCAPLFYSVVWRSNRYEGSADWKSFPRHLVLL